MKNKIHKIVNNYPPLLKVLFDTMLIFILFILFFYIGLKILSVSGGYSKISLYLSEIKISSDLTQLRLSQAVSALSLFVFPPVIISLFYTFRIGDFYRLNKSAFSLNYFYVIILIIAVVPITNILAEFNTSIHFPQKLSDIEELFRNAELRNKLLTEKFLFTNSTSDFIQNIIVLALLPAVGEELFFRGLIQKRFIELLKNSHIAIFITAFIFSAVHFQFFTFLPRLFLGVILGYLFVWSKSIWLPILAHFFNNFMAVAVSFIYFKNNNSNTDEINTFGTDAATFYFSLFSVAVVGFILFLIYKNEKKN